MQMLGCSKLESKDLCDSNAVSHVFLRQKLVPVAQIKVLPIWDRLASSRKKTSSLYTFKFSCVEL